MSNSRSKFNDNFFDDEFYLLKDFEPSFPEPPPEWETELKEIESLLYPTASEKIESEQIESEQKEKAPEHEKKVKHTSTHIILSDLAPIL